MKLMLLLTSFLLVGSSAWSQNTWVKTFGGAGGQSGNSITRTSDGGVLILGATSSNDGDFKGLNKGNLDIILIKLDRDGSLEWKKSFGGTDRDLGFSLTTMSDESILITGETYSNDGDFAGMSKTGGDIFVMRLDRFGVILWKKTFGGRGGEWGQSIAASRDGGILVTGRTGSNDGDFEEVRKGSEDVFVIKLDKDGGVLWIKNFGGTNGQYGTSVTTAVDDGVFITGRTNSNDGDFKGLNKGIWDAFVIHLDKNGQLIWSKTVGGTNDDWGQSITTTSDGDVVVTGETFSSDVDFVSTNKGMSDIFVMKLNRSGEIKWTEILGGKEREKGLSVSTTYTGSVLVTGVTESTDGDFEGVAKAAGNIFVLKLNENGALQWKKLFGGSMYEVGHSITSSEDEGIHVTGMTESNDGDFNGMRKGGQDAFVIKLDSNGKLDTPTSIQESQKMSEGLLVWPNPLSTSSTLTYHLESQSCVHIELVNTVGQVVVVLFDGYRESGTHTLPIEVSSLTSGMYALRMTTSHGLQATAVCIAK